MYFIACPQELPESWTSCVGEMTCNYGEECCCGECHPSLIATCVMDGNGGKKWLMTYTDACMIDGCPSKYMKC